MTSTPYNSFVLERVAERFQQAYFIYHIEKRCFLYLNSAFAEILETTREYIQKNTMALHSSVHPDDTDFLTGQYEKLKTEGELSKAEFRIVLPGQIIKWICLTAHLFEDEDKVGRCIGGYAEDITKIKAYMNNILKFNNKKNSTLEILSHDLAAPFANIQGMANLMELQNENNGDGNQLLLDYIKENAKRGSDMIRDFVDNEFMESSQVVLNKERVDIADKIRVMMDNYKRGSALIAKQFELVVLERPIFIYVDEMKFLQVMNNLMSNAIKFTQDNGKVTVSVEEQDENVLISVADNGVGIPKELQPMLFEKFTKSRRQGVRGEKTVGLGMSIIKNIVELHEGKIEFESQENVGSTFYIRIPKAG